MSFQITALYTALLTIVYLVLSVRISALRKRNQIGVGTGRIPELRLATRAHANFIEYVPLALLLLLLLEAHGVGTVWLSLFGGLLLLARVLHAVGLTRSDGVSAGRFLGILLTWSLMAIGATANLWLVFSA